MLPRACLPLFLLLLAPVLAADRLAPSAQPPAGLAVAQVPQFVTIGFDDNPEPDPINWVVDFLATKHNAAGGGQAATYDGAPVHVGFFSNGIYWKNPAVVAAHQRAFAAGHEIDNHTLTHSHGRNFTMEQWRTEMAWCDEVFVKGEIPVASVLGFRAPFLEYNAATFEASAALGRVYDTSIEEGFQRDQDGTNFLWPYTLDEGSPGHRASAAGKKGDLGRYPGLWEIAIGVFIIPADADCARYGVAPGLRDRVKASIKATAGYDWNTGGKLTGLDWNSFEQAHLTPAEFLATLKHTLDLRLAGNRAPMMICGHTALYPANLPERRKAMEAFIEYALSKPEVRIVTGGQLLAWLRTPQPLK